jgi:tetratricopeptide (TPR) repeat protein
MNIRTLSIVLLGSVAVVAASGSAQAAVTVIGSGPAELCYQGAENGGEPRDYIAFCNQALGGLLTTRDRAATFINRGVLKLSLSESNAALDDFNSGLTIDATLGEGFVDRGAALIALKRFDDAIKDIDRGLTLGAKQPEIAYYDRAMADEALGNIPAAYNDYQQSLAAEPGFSLASDELKRFKVVKKSDGT